MSSEIDVLINDHKHLCDKVDSMSKSLEKVSNKIDCFDKRFIIMDERSKLRRGFWSTVGNQWWKILAVMIPIIGFVAGIIDFVYKLDPPV